MSNDSGNAAFGIVEDRCSLLIAFLDNIDQQQRFFVVVFQLVLITVGATWPVILAGRFVFRSREEVVEEIINGKMTSVRQLRQPLKWLAWLAGLIYYQSNVPEQYAEIQKAANLKHIRFLDLRHIAASIMLNHGIPLLTVSYILGHSQPSTTLNMYGHQFSAMELQAACLVDDIFAGAQPSPLPAEFLSVANLKN